MPTLLEKAQQSQRARGSRSKFNAEEIDLAYAWMNDEVALTQVQAAMQHAGTAQTYAFLAQCARQIFQSGRKKR